ncbi:uncharacterized protein N0V89_004629 [Didymosphaeria variabile]|uniref:Uncharacterized protein n=1 Tax=Didymosphaeria variabile TaxID=1932322 RepID=A0A9W8XQM1_9PLEO|nr:uncharacterized protein N0V89_004629 [Didymosphaeria variabile]KAJ4356594.1 hypothetical protein N0V89_004629 [Didymosphaeria variabile]
MDMSYQAKRRCLDGVRALNATDDLPEPKKHFLELFEPDSAPLSAECKREALFNAVLLNEGYHRFFDRQGNLRRPAFVEQKNCPKQVAHSTPAFGEQDDCWKPIAHFTTQDQTIAFEYDNSDVEDDNTAIEDDYTTIKNDYTAIKNYYTAIDDDYTTIGDGYTAIKNSYTAIQNRLYTDIQNNYTAIEDDYTAIEDDDEATEDDDEATEDDDEATEDDDEATEDEKTRKKRLRLVFCFRRYFHERLSTLKQQPSNRARPYSRKSELARLRLPPEPRSAWKAGIRVIRRLQRGKLPQTVEQVVLCVMTADAMRSSTGAVSCIRNQDEFWRDLHRWKDVVPVNDRKLFEQVVYRLWKQELDNSRKAYQSDNLFHFQEVFQNLLSDLNIEELPLNACNGKHLPFSQSDNANRSSAFRQSQSDAGSDTNESSSTHRSENYTGNWTAHDDRVILLAATIIFCVVIAVIMYIFQSQAYIKFTTLLQKIPSHGTDLSTSHRRNCILIACYIGLSTRTIESIPFSDGFNPKAPRPCCVCGQRLSSREIGIPVARLESRPPAAPGHDPDAVQPGINQPVDWDIHSAAEDSLVSDQPLLIPTEIDLHTVALDLEGFVAPAQSLPTGHGLNFDNTLHNHPIDLLGQQPLGFSSAFSSSQYSFVPTRANTFDTFPATAMGAHQPSWAPSTNETYNSMTMSSELYDPVPLTYDPFSLAPPLPASQVSFPNQLGLPFPGLSDPSAAGFQPIAGFQTTPSFQPTADLQPSNHLLNPWNSQSFPTAHAAYDFLSFDPNFNSTSNPFGAASTNAWNLEQQINGYSGLGLGLGQEAQGFDSVFANPDRILKRKEPCSIEESGSLVDKRARTGDVDAFDWDSVGLA